MNESARFHHVPREPSPFGAEDYSCRKAEDAKPRIEALQNKIYKVIPSEFRDPGSFLVSSTCSSKESPVMDQMKQSSQQSAVIGGAPQYYMRSRANDMSYQMSFGKKSQLNSSTKSYTAGGAKKSTAATSQSPAAREEIATGAVLGAHAAHGVFPHGLGISRDGMNFFHFRKPKVK